LRTYRSILAALLALTLSGVFALVLAVPAGAQASPCPPGQPTGRPPGTPPNDAGQPDGRPPYPPGRCNLALSQSAADRGQTVQARGEGFVPGETVAFSIGGRQVATAVADSTGAAVADLTVPNDAAYGRTEVTASGEAQVLSAAFEVVAPAAADRGRSSAAAAAGAGVARTGAAIAAMTLLGVTLLGLGAVFVVGARRRRPAAAA